MCTISDNKEFKKISINKQLFAMYKTDHFDIDIVLKILNVTTLPIDIPLNNNRVFIRDISNYMANNNLELKPNIKKK